MAISTVETLLGDIQTQLEAQISGIHITEQVDVVTMDPRTLADQGTAVVHVGDEYDPDYPVRLAGFARVTDEVEVQTAWQVEPRAQLTSRDALLARARAIRVALTGTWGDVAGRRATYLGSAGPVRHPASAEWLLVTQRFAFSRFAQLGA